MEKNVRFYRCSTCGNVLGLIEGDAEHIMCCGKQVELMEANTSDGAVEKHVPVCEKAGEEIVVKVGEVEHPMIEDHYIQWVAQVTDDRTTRVRLRPGQATETRFPYIPNSLIFAYCNKHGLWKKVVE